MSLPQFLLVTESQVDPKVEDAWNDWYDNVHLPEITGCPGFVSSTRYVAEDGDTRRYLALYELEDLSAVETVEFNERRGWGPFGADVVFSTRTVRRIAEQGSSDVANE